MISALPLANRGLLRISGEERIAFLQGLLTNDVSLIGPDTAIHAALLTPQGRLLHDLILAAHDDAILVETEAARLQDLMQRLARYRLRARVAIEDVTDRFEVLALIDGDGGVDLPAVAGAARPALGGVVMVDPRSATLGRRWLLPRGVATPIGDPGDYRRRRLAIGIGEGGADFGEASLLALEANLDLFNGVSFTKGCYVGQEVTARSHHRKLIRRRLRPVRVEGTPPPPGTPILAGDQEAGELRSSIAGLALALLRLDALDAGPLTAAGVSLVPLPPAGGR